TWSGLLLLIRVRPKMPGVACGHIDANQDDKRNTGEAIRVLGRILESPAVTVATLRIPWGRVYLGRRIATHARHPASLAGITPVSQISNRLAARAVPTAALIRRASP